MAAWQRWPLLKKFCDQMRKTGGRAHLIGLTSQGGVHSHSDHILALASALRARQVPVTLHILTDGRDTLAKTGRTQPVLNFYASCRMAAR